MMEKMFEKKRSLSFKTSMTAACYIARTLFLAMAHVCICVCVLSINNYVKTNTRKLIVFRYVDISTKNIWQNTIRIRRLSLERILCCKRYKEVIKCQLNYNLGKSKVKELEHFCKAEL